MELYAYPILALLFVAIFTREVIAPASKNLCDHRWLVLSAGLACGTVLVTLAIGYVFSHFIHTHAVFQASYELPDIAVGFLSFFLTSFLFYWWHRATHHWDILWRIFHQLHHSPRRIEALTAFYAHPLDTSAAVLISTFSSYLILGASPFAAGFALFLTGAFDLFLHSDIHTPKWLGYFVQRPEMHTVHHELGHHAQNYGLPVWDILFSTWCNPHRRVEQCGFTPDRSERLHDMLLCRDVHKS